MQLIGEVLLILLKYFLCYFSKNDCGDYLCYMHDLEL